MSFSSRIRRDGTWQPTTPAVSVPKWLRRKRNKGVVRVRDHRSFQSDGKRTSTRIQQTAPNRRRDTVSKVRARAFGRPVAPSSPIESTHLSNEAQSFSRTYIPLFSLLDLCEDPGLDQSPASDHNPIHSTVFNPFPIILRREDVSTAKDRDRRYCGREEKTPQISRSFQTSKQG